MCTKKVYIFKADIYCEECATGIMRALDKACGPRPLESHDDSEVYPVGPIANGGGEADSPQHCGECHTFLGNPLTPDGRAYVREALASGQGDSAVLAVWREAYGQTL